MIFGAWLSSAVDPRRLILFFSLLSGIWSDCGPPPKLKNAFIRESDTAERYPVGAVLFYYCVEGFYNIRGKSDGIGCLPDSTWSDIEEFCEGSCLIPRGVKFARPDYKLYSYYPVGTTVNFVCYGGYNRIPGVSSIITCLHNFTWSEVPAFCEAKSCGDPGKPEHGRAVILTDFLYRARVMFICEDGYTLIGSNLTRCRLKKGKVEWDPKLPYCQRRSCRLPPFDNGRIDAPDGTMLGETITFTCDEGYRRIGTPSARCMLFDGKVEWDKNSPYCERIPCLPPPDIDNGRHTEGDGGEYNHGIVVIYTCLKDFSLIGSESIACETAPDGINGQWSGPAPECKGPTSKPAEEETTVGEIGSTEEPKTTPTPGSNHHSTAIIVGTVAGALGVTGVIIMSLRHGVHLTKEGRRTKRALCGSAESYRVVPHKTDMALEETGKPLRT